MHKRKANLPRLASPVLLTSYFFHYLLFLFFSRVLPHSPLVDKKDVCVITRDLEKGLKVDHEATINHFKELLEEKSVEVASVMSLRELKAEYKAFETKTALVHRHEAFLADVRIVRLLPKFLGKPFYKRKKFPIQVNLQAHDLQKEFDKALRTVMLPAHNKGSTMMMTVGHTSMKPNHLVDNILQATEVLSKQFSGGWKNIRAIHVKTETSIAIPLHISKASPNDIGFVDTKAPIKKVKEDITDELSTIPDVNVTVMPDFSLKVDGLDKKEHQIEDIQENSDVDEEDSEEQKPSEEKTNSKKRKLEKKNGKEVSSTTKDDKSSKKKKMAEVESSDDEDDEIEEAENAYLQKNNENEVSNEEGNKDDQESEDDEEEDDGEEEDGDDDGSGEEESEDE